MNTQTDRRVQNSYDYHAKNILREKNILVHIIKALVPEFRDMSTKDIRKYICKGQEGEDSDLITQSGIDVEFEDESGKIKTDIKFDLALPEKYKTDIRFLIMVDIEPQNDNRDYKPVQRGIYYASKMISMQKGQTFISSEYDRIQQVYSIWICFNPPAEERGTIRLYNMKEENILGDYKEDPTRYDLMRIAVINLDLSPDIRTDEKTKGEYYNEDVDNTMKILSRLFKSHEGTRKILDGIRELGVEMTPTMTKEAEDMAYVGDAPYTQGWDEGREDGLKKKSIDVAQKMIAKGTFDNDTISELTGLTIEQIDELRNS